MLLAIFCSVTLLIAPNLDVYSNTGIFSKILSFVQSLPGFYLAALAAISTFPSQNMDQLMLGIPPKAKIWYNDSLQEVELTRRRMLCMLFAYLTALSFGLTLVLICATSFASPLAQILPANATLVLRIIGCFFVTFLLMQMLVITLWGLFYIGERVHTPDRSTETSNS